MESPVKILIIDDEVGIIKGCQRVLEPQGFTTESALTLHEGRQKIENGTYDVVLLDIMLPDGQGIDLLAPMREKDPDLVCVVMTGYASVELAVQAIKAGAYNLIAKPFSYDMLLVTINQALEKRRLSIEAKRLRALEQDAAALVAVAKEELERLEHFKKTFSLTTAFTLTVAHEVRAPLTALQSFLFLLRKGYVSPDQQEKIIETAIERAQDLLDLVDDLMNLATVREELTAPNRKVMSLADSLEKVVPLLKTHAEDKGLSFTVDVRHRPMVTVNPGQIAQVWSNLISNAIKYTHAGGSVKVILEEAGTWAVGTVEDSGIGIPADDQYRVFMEFYRTSQAKEMDHRGAGLGLPLVKRIVEGYEGTIEVESAVGKGSRFVFKLPKAKSSENLTT